MARHKDQNWKIPDRPENWTQANTAVLMDIRDELKRLNSLLNCPNFIAIPRTLRRISANTHKPKRRKKSG